MSRKSRLLAFQVSSGLTRPWFRQGLGRVQSLQRRGEQAPLTYQSRQATDANPEQKCPGWAQNPRNKQWAPVRQEQGMGSLCFSPTSASRVVKGAGSRKRTVLLGCCQLPNRIACDAGHTGHSGASHTGPVRQVVKLELLSCHVPVRLRACSRCVIKQRCRLHRSQPASSREWSLTAATIALMVAALSMLRRGRAGASNGTMLRCSRRPHAPGASCRDMGWLGLLTISRGPGRSQCERSTWASRLV